MARTCRWTNEQLEEAVKGAHCVRDVLLALGLKSGGDSSDLIQKRIVELGLDCSHWNNRAWKPGKPRGRKRSTLKEMLKLDSGFKGYTVKEKLLREGIWDHECQRCTRSTWLGEGLWLEIHHINGNSNDHRYKNLELLCPNCHSLTRNYRWRNKSRVE